MEQEDHLLEKDVIYVKIIAHLIEQEVLQLQLQLQDEMMMQFIDEQAFHL